MKIYTGYFAKAKKYQEAGLFPICIARFNRFWSGARMLNLAPPKEMIHDVEEVYTPKFNRILLTQDRNKVLQDIRIVSGGKDVILLCYEKEGTFCHRNLIAKWLGEYCQGEFQIESPTELKLFK